MHTHPNYYPMRNHLIEFLVNRSKTFAAEISAEGFDPRKPPTARPAAGVAAAGGTNTNTTTKDRWATPEKKAS